MLGHKVGYNPVQFMVDNPTGTWMWNAQNKRCKKVEDYVVLPKEPTIATITSADVDSFLKTPKQDS